MQYLTPILVSVSTVLTGILSAFIAYKGQSKSADVTAEDNRLDHNDALLGAYSQMVEDLRAEVARLKETIAEMREDQEACDERNEALNKRVVELTARVGELEKR